MKLSYRFASWVSRAVRVAAPAIAGFAALAVGAPSASAGVLPLGTSGWTASWDSSLDANLSLAVTSQSAAAVNITKNFTFNTNDPVSIVFQQTSPNAVQSIVIDEETLVNATGSPWSGFRFNIQGALTGPGVPQFNPANTAVGAAGGFSITPFPAGTFSDAGFGDGVPRQLSVDAGGTVPSGPPSPAGPNVWHPGLTSGSLWISAAPLANGTQNFTLKELPITNAVPTPAAAFTGMTTMLGLGALGLLRRARG